jgi:hypothetical protein
MIDFQSSLPREAVPKSLPWMLSSRAWALLPKLKEPTDGWPTFTFFVKVGIHAAGNHAVEYKSRMELESNTQNQNNKLSASVAHLYKKRKGGPPVRSCFASCASLTSIPPYFAFQA